MKTTVKSLTEIATILECEIHQLRFAARVAPAARGLMAPQIVADSCEDELWRIVAEGDLTNAYLPARKRALDLSDTVAAELGVTVEDRT